MRAFLKVCGILHQRRSRSQTPANPSRIPRFCLCLSLTRIRPHTTFPSPSLSELVKPMLNDRRQFLLQSAPGLSVAWLSANWPPLLSAAEHARSQATSAAAKKFEFLTPDQAAEVEAVSERILPAD